MATVYLGLGSNKGERLDNLRRGVALLSPKVDVQKISTVYETAPMASSAKGSGGPQYLEGQDYFFNIAIRGETRATPFDLFKLVKDIERQLGRTEALQNGPRELDIDILLFDDLILNTPELQIPHPRMHERAFVLVPLEEIARRVVHPVLGKEIIELWDDIGGGAGLVWELRESI